MSLLNALKTPREQATNRRFQDFCLPAHPLAAHEPAQKADYLHCVAMIATVDENVAKEGRRPDFHNIMPEQMENCRFSAE